MKTIAILILKNIFFLALLLISFGAFAEEWSVPQFTACKVMSGSADQSQYRLKVLSTSVIVTCGLTKKAGTNTLQRVGVRMVRPNTNTAPPYCLLSSQMELYTNRSTSVKWGSARVSVQEISLPIPTQYNTGYLTVTCALYHGDELYGIAYRQAD